MKDLLKFLAALAIIFVLLPFGIKAQPVFKRNDNIMVSVNGDTLSMPWVGGFNNPEFWAMDINNDGILDLVVFDRGNVEYTPDLNGDKILTFINHGTPNKIDYVYAPEYEQYFPGVSRFMLVADMNCDGVSDILTSSSEGNIIMYLGHFNDSSKLYYTGPDTLKFHDVGETMLNPITLILTSVPAAVDVDGDGDIDILAFDFFTGSYVNMFQNESMELSSTCGDSIVFSLAHNCWGNMDVSTSTNQVSYNVSCFYQPAKNADPRHMGATVCAFDQDGNGTIDLLLGDITYNVLTSVINGGTKENANMVPPADSTFPNYDKPVNIPIYPAAFYLDVDNDGKKDLLVGPNLPDQPPSYAVGTSENVACSWFYKNISTNDTVNFHYVTDSFLVNQMIDLGEGAYPAFIDVDGDGLLDMIVGNMGYFVDTPTQHLQGQLAYFRNIGTKAQPAFQLVDRDFAKLSAITVNGLPIAGVAPAFGDMDGDGDLDMIVGNADASGVLLYFENTAGPGKPVSFSLKSKAYSGISVQSGNTVPYIYDVNGDSLPDIIVGKEDGKIYYFQNRGTPTNPQFDQVATNPYFGQIDVRTLIPGSTYDLTGYSSPIITKLDSTGKPYVLVGAEEGKIYEYELDRDSIMGGAFKLVTMFNSGIDEGEYTNLAVAQLTNNGSYVMVTGNYRGGLTYYNQSDTFINGIDDHSGIATLNFNLFPNPANKQVSLVWQANNMQGTPEIELTDVLGRRLIFIQADVVPGAKGSATIDVSNLAKGIYNCRLIIGSQYLTRTLLIQ